MIEKLYTVEEVAELASVTGRTIRNYLKSGRLVGRKIGGQWRFPEAEVQRLLTGAEPEFVEAPAPAAAPVYYDEPSEVTYDYEEELPIEPMAEDYSAAPTAPPSLTVAPPLAAAEPVPQPAPAPQPVYTPPAQQQTGSFHAAPAPLPQAENPFAAQPMQQPSYQPPVYANPQPAPQGYEAQPQQPTGPVYVDPMRVSPVTPAGEGGYVPAGGYGVPPSQQPPVAYAVPSPGMVYEPVPVQPYSFTPPAQIPTAYPPSPSAGGYYAMQQPAAPPAAPEAEAAKPEEVAKEPAKPAQKDDALPISDVAKRVTRFMAEVHDCSGGPQMCAVIDLNQSLSSAKLTSERLAGIADEESAGGLLCQAFVEFDDRYSVARYTLFGTTLFLQRCLKLLG